MAEQNKLTRRGLFAGIGMIAAAGATAKLLKPSAEVAAMTAETEATKGDGYRLSEHIKKYYRTTTI
jgi:hypothetical protein